MLRPLLSVSTPALLQPLTLRGVTLPNRLVVAPMCQYRLSPWEGPDPVQVSAPA